MLTDFSSKGSQRWLQVAVNLAPESLNVPLRDALGLAPDRTVEWLSPLREERFVEYRDQAFLDRLGCPVPPAALREFWPSGGPVWDGLARVGSDAYLLVEAKGHVQEMISGPTRASEKSRARIEASIREVQKALAPRSVDYVDWTSTFYQYTNRLAHLHFLREHGVPAHLFYVCFLHAADVNGPTERAEWIGATRVIEGYLGLGRHRLSRYVHKVFVDVRELPDPRPAGAVVGGVAVATD